MKRRIVLTSAGTEGTLPERHRDFSRARKASLMGSAALGALCIVTAAHAADPAPAVDAVQTIHLRGDAGGKRFEGFGVVDGGGGTSVLLKDYPEPQRSQILDLIYKPNVGASVSALYVEIPGDGNSTQGSMPSHMHTRGDLNYDRGYTWWVMTEAHKRNPGLVLDGTIWSAPGWIGDRGGLFAGSGDARFFSQDTADYYVAWLRGLRDVYGLQMDALGMRNEKGVSYGLVKAMRKTLNASGFGKVRLHAFDNWPDDTKFDFVKDLDTDPELAAAIDVISAHVNTDTSTVPAGVRATADRLGKPIWNTEAHVYKAGYDGLIGNVESFNENYVHNGMTRFVNWYGIAGLYTMESYSGAKEAALRANWPWSGHYEPNPSLWGYAHYGQFTRVGWTYIDGGSGDLRAGGTFVTLKSPGKDYSVIIETHKAAAPQRVRFEIGRGLARGSLAVWRSDAQSYFTRQADLVPVHGAVELTLEPDAVYSITTTRGQRKGVFADVPPLRPFPFPYRDTFDAYAHPRQWGYLPHYFADIAGAFELAGCPARPGLCLHQAVPVPTLSWGPDWKPYTIIGDDGWTDYEVSADVHPGPGESAAVMGRVNDVGTGYGIIPKGYFLQLEEGGRVSLVVVRGKADKKALVGDGEQQALIKAQHDGGEGGEKVLATGQVAGAGWHTLKLRFAGTTIVGFVDGKQVVRADDALYGHGMAGLMAGPTAHGFSMPYFDNVVLNRVDGPLPEATQALPGQAPIYPGKD
jgi:galactosylceramidase